MVKNSKKTNSQKTKSTISPARLSAFDILLKIEKEKAFSSVLLPLYEKNLETKDRALCHLLTLGTLRKQILLDRMIAIFVTKKIDPEVRIILRMGIFQLLFLDKIPDYSVLNESVNLASAAKKTSAKGFVNAVLRKVLCEEADFSYSDEIDRISVQTSHPRWLIEKWVSEFGIQETEKLAMANNETPRLDFRTTAKTSPQLKERFLDLERSELLELAEKGEIYFQDKASQLVGQAVDLQENEKFLDICAAPGVN